MKLDILPIGLYQENVYLLHDRGHVLIVDPGANAKVIRKYVGDGEKVDAIVLTHGHEDHTVAVDDLVDLWHCPVYLHPADRDLVDPALSKGIGYASPIYAQVNDLCDPLQAGIFSLTVYHTPGHTEGSCCIRCKNILFSGDTLFAGSCGRTDLYSGDEQKMLSSLRFLKTLPTDVTVYPGHGPSTTIGQEAAVNMFMQGL